MSSCSHSHISDTTLTSNDTKLKQSGTSTYTHTMYVYTCTYFDFHFPLATQMWCLARYLPLMVGDLVSNADEQWNHYLKLLEIIDYTFAPVITADKSAYIGMLIEDFLEDFCQLYPDRWLIPKMHYMVHIPSWILKYAHQMERRGALNNGPKRLPNIFESLCSLCRFFPWY